MHHRVDTPPSQENYKPREWQKPHHAEPHRHGRRLPAEGLDRWPTSKRPRVTGDYDAWTPGG